MKDKTAFDSGVTYVSLLSSTLALCSSSLTMLNVGGFLFRLCLVVFFIICAIVSLIFTFISMRKERKYIQEGVMLAVNCEHQNQFSLDVSVQNTAVQTEPESGVRKNEAEPVGSDEKGQDYGSNK